MLTMNQKIKGRDDNMELFAEKREPTKREIVFYIAAAIFIYATNGPILWFMMIC